MRIQSSIYQSVDKEGNKKGHKESKENLQAGADYLRM
jgi:hypothetical protein